MNLKKNLIILSAIGMAVATVNFIYPFVGLESYFFSGLATLFALISIFLPNGNLFNIRSRSAKDRSRVKNVRLDLQNIEIDGSFISQCKRIHMLVNDGAISPELGSLLLSYYAMGRNEAAGESNVAADYCKANSTPGMRKQ